ncbi:MULTISPECIES: TRAP transporter substrate-binding protein [Pseudomonas]|uniref:Putative TRAP dicarboxylate transporter subunit DctP n=1 Tax=Pseudomonas luteola TaxID=47886 RepID=A0A2X2D1H4_PSELU|nr:MULTISPECIES: TRAP transporter substrate-binding protein [Pseudomonas]ENA29734.1 DctP family TRAP transporter solute receptor [Pseudomonas sp. HPB0071]MBA1247695.1 TRAP transporter substrate-binding protein [Pseudomonas zeshuii]MBF8640708.1 TRAP transporter substrate-binding protein [Pseudomonas zeshuii]MBW5413361.1 DctP family TRAP transporter solute-binding subunit [Pseudomonas sp. MAG002Y]QEU29219.1 TRAP transporter substrate-binding protein [Pseudomonas luteola]
MNFKRNLLAAACCALLTPAIALADITLKSSDVHPAGYPTVVAVDNMGKKLKKETDGELSIRMFPGGVLGSEKEVVEQVQLGAIQMARISIGSVGPVVPEVNVFNLPFVFRDEAHMRKVIDGEVGQELLDTVTNSNFNLVALGWMDGGTRHLYTKKPVRKIEDLGGMKIRVIGNPIFIDTLNAMGGSGIAMATGEIYSALQTGVIDGAENNPPTMVTQNHFQVAKYYTQTGHLILPEMLVMSKATWNKLTPDQQALVKKTAREAQMEERELWDKYNAESVAKLKAANVEFIEVDRKPFYDATAPVREKYSQQYGPKFAELVKRVEAVQ